MEITSTSPILQVRDLEASLSFYCDILGFTQTFIYGEPSYYAGVSRDESCLHLNQIEENKDRQGKGSVYFFCDEVDGYYEAISSAGAEITSPLGTYPYGMRDFQIKDPDGNLLCFGQTIED